MLSEQFDIPLEKAWESRKSDLRNSFDVAIRLKKKAEDTNYQKGIADACKILGYCYWRFSDYSKSLDCSLKAIDFYKILDDKRGEADTLNSIGAVYMFQKDNQKRLECNIKCFELRNEICDFDGVSGSMNNIGETYFEMRDYKNAAKWLMDCLHYEHSPTDSRAWAYHNLGRIEQVKRNYESAAIHYTKCLELTAVDKYDVLTCETYLKLCELNISAKNFEAAENYGELSLELSKEIGAKEYKEQAYKSLSSIYESKENHKKALYFHKKYLETHLTIFNETNSQHIKDIGYQYEIDRISKEAEIERLKKVELVKANQLIAQKNQLIEQKNKDITDSIRYAKKIQQALLSPDNQLAQYLSEHFIYYRPKDIVSGDFYWFSKKGDYLYLAVADCTGHGVPGAFLTMLGTSFLNEIIGREGAISTNKLLDKLREKFIAELGSTETKDGMDISMIRLHLVEHSFEWSGALRPLYIFRQNTLTMEMFPGDKQSVCYIDKKAPFTATQGTINQGDIVYLFSDGFPDQFGGPRGKKFKISRLLEFLQSVHHHTMKEQREQLEATFTNWKGEFEQIDDVCVIGVKL